MLPPPQTQPSQPAQPVGLYADAMVYDTLHTPGTAEEIDSIARITNRCVRTKNRQKNQRWLEPACGSGRCIRTAAARGVRTTGFDLEVPMIQYANARLARAGLADLGRAVVADMRTVVDDGAIEPGSFDAAFNTINSFRHLMSDRDVLAHLDQIARALRPGGVYIVGLSTCAYGLEFPTEDVWIANRGRLAVTQTVQFIPPTGPAGGARIERVHSHLTITKPNSTEHRDSSYALRTYSLDQWLDLIARSPMGLHKTADHDGDLCDPSESGYRLYVLGNT